MCIQLPELNLFHVPFLKLELLYQFSMATPDFLRLRFCCYQKGWWEG